MNRTFIGTSGYNYKDWKDVFYKDISQRQWLHFYSENFDTVELNATFYRGFPKHVFENWYEQTVQDFTFTIKAPRMITHYKKLVDIDESLEMFFESVFGLKEKLSVVLWQFPASFFYTELNKEKLAALFTKLPANITHVAELRHDSWFTMDTVNLLNKYAIGFVINDSGVFAARDFITGGLVYIRFHGPGSLYSSLYSEDHMEKWAKKIREYQQSYDVYCYFNNDYFGYALTNANQLRRLC